MHDNQVRGLARIRRDQRGITGIETAIVLIAFVVVASVFAFAVLSTGLLSSEKAKETALGGLAETSSTLVLRGSVVGTADTGLTKLTNVKFQLGTAAESSEGVDLSATGAVITYLDGAQSLNLVAADWTATWLIGTGPLVDPGELVEVNVNTALTTDIPAGPLATALAASTEFTIQVRPIRGAVVVVNRTTPAEFTAVVDLS